MCRRQQLERIAQLPCVSRVRITGCVGELRESDREVADAHAILPADDDEERIHAHHVPRRAEQRGRPVDEREVVVAVEEGDGFVVDLSARSEKGAVDPQVF